MRPPPKRSDPSPLRGPPLPRCAELWLWGWGAAEPPPLCWGRRRGPGPARRLAGRRAQLPAAGGAGRGWGRSQQAEEGGEALRGR